MTASRRSAKASPEAAAPQDTKTTAPEDEPPTSAQSVPEAGAPITVFLPIPTSPGITLRYIAERQYGSHELCKAGHALRNSAQSTSLIQSFVSQHGDSLSFVEGHLRFGV